jgi:hydrogenase maturation protease
MKVIPHSFLVMGIGNPSRRDDGAGPETVRRLEGLSLQGVECRTAMQLDPVLAVDLASYDALLVVDADVGAVKVDITPAPEEISGASTHHFTPSTLRALAVALRGKAPEVWVCRIPARDFEFGEVLSPSAESAVTVAVGKIEEFIQNRTADEPTSSPSGKM